MGVSLVTSLRRDNCFWESLLKRFLLQGVVPPSQNSATTSSDEHYLWFLWFNAEKSIIEAAYRFGCSDICGRDTDDWVLCRSVFITAKLHIRSLSLILHYDRLLIPIGRENVYISSRTLLARSVSFFFYQWLHFLRQRGSLNLISYFTCTFGLVHYWLNK